MTHGPARIWKHTGAVVALLFLMSVLGVFLGIGELSAADLQRQNLQRLVPGLSDQEAATLQKSGMVRSYSEDKPLQFQFLPESTVSAHIREGFRELRPAVINEVLILLPPLEQSGDTILELSNTLRSVSSLSGITYGSARTAILFNDVYAVRSLRDRRAIPDPLLSYPPQTQLPTTDTITLHLTDVHFGSSYFEATYLYGQDAAAMALTNVVSLSYIIPVIRPRRVRFQIVAIPMESALLLYGIVVLEAGPLARRAVDMPGFLRLRIDALTDWFVEDLYR